MNENRELEEKLNKKMNHTIKENDSYKNKSDLFFEAVGLKINTANRIVQLQTLDELLERDVQREKDGFPRRIRLGKIVKQNQKSNQVVIVPSTTEPKFYHDDSYTDEDQLGGAGEGEEGEVIGESPLQPQEGEGEGQGAGQGDGEGHEVISNAFELGKILTEKFQLPNLKPKGKKRSFNKYTYDLTDRNRRTGQILDKKETLRKIIKTNIILGNIDSDKDLATDELIINPNDSIYRILSPEKDYESTAVVFFIRDYSGSMQGRPTEAVTTQHLFIYSWLMYQYNQNVQTRFILHDQNAKEVPDFYVYHNSNVAGGTNVYPAFELVNKIVFDEQLARDNNIYVFYGTDGDDWDADGKKAIEEIEKILTYCSRMGITIAKNSWGGSSYTTVEKYIDSSGLLQSRSELIKMDSFTASDVDENRLVEGIKKLVEQTSR